LFNFLDATHTAFNLDECTGNLAITQSTLQLPDQHQIGQQVLALLSVVESLGLPLPFASFLFAET
jgi:hypothetical protein